MRYEFAVYYLYQGKWIEFAKHTNRGDAIKDRDMLSARYKARVCELHPKPSLEAIHGF